MRFSPTPVPFDYAATELVSGWRENLFWPSDPRTSSTIVEEQMRTYLFFAAQQDPFVASALMLASAAVLSLAIVYAETAQAAQNASTRGIDLVGGPEEVAFLRGDKVKGDLAPPADHIPQRWVPPRLAGLRRIKISASMSGWRGVIRYPYRGPVSISRNSLMDRYVRANSSPLHYRHPATILAKVAPDPGVKFEADQLRAVAATLCQRLTDVTSLEDPFRGRFEVLLQRFSLGHVVRAAEHLACCVRSAAIPDTVWSGSGGAYTARLIGLAARLRGGSAIRFDHGGPSLLAVDNRLCHSQIEDSVSTEVVLASKTLESVASNYYQDGPFSEKESVIFRSGPGDPAFGLAAHGNVPVRPRGNGKKVLYAPTLLSGFWQYIIPDLPDVVSLDWQMRLAIALARLPIDLVCKPHPEGVLGGMKSPLESVANVSYALFEEHMIDTDVFVLDLMSSTTFWKALSSDRPVVYLDMGINRFAPWILPLIERRCRVVKVDYDDRNRPTIDQSELEAAVLDTPHHHDGGEIRFLMGAPDAPAFV